MSGHSKVLRFSVRQNLILVHGATRNLGLYNTPAQGEMSGSCFEIMCNQTDLRNPRGKPLGDFGIKN